MVILIELLDNQVIDEAIDYRIILQRRKSRIRDSMSFSNYIYCVLIRNVFVLFFILKNRRNRPN